MLTFEQTSVTSNATSTIKDRKPIRLTSKGGEMSFGKLLTRPIVSFYCCFSVHNIDVFLIAFCLE